MRITHIEENGVTMTVDRWLRKFDQGEGRKATRKRVTKFVEIPEFQISPRVTVRPGDLIHVSGGSGSTWTRDDGEETPYYRQSGLFVIELIEHSKRPAQVWMSIKSRKSGLVQRIFVEGRDHKSDDDPRVTHKPQKIRRKKEPSR
jgi:hypothetical protein